MICIYHNKDFDGIASACIVKLKYPNIELVGYDYGENFSTKLKKGEPIIFVDVSFPMEKMFEMSKLSDWHLTWIDHHISKIKDYEKFIEKNGEFCTAVLNNDISACEGVWNYYFPKKEMPIAIKLLGMYDTWRENGTKMWTEEIRPFQYGMKSAANSVNNFPSELLEPGNAAEDLVKKIIENGKEIIKYEDSKYEQLMKNKAFECEFEGLKAICYNGDVFNSEYFKSVYDPNKHDLMMPFQRHGNRWSFSLYTTKDDVDCSELAKRYGGGGHKKAAGFEADDLNKVIKRL